MTTPCAASLEADKAIEPDALLVRRSLEGDLTCFEALVRRYERAARVTTLRILRDQHLAEDSAQEAFIAAFKNLHALRDANNFGAWVLTIARQRALRTARERRRLLQLAETAMESSKDTHALGQEDSLLHALAILPEHERVVVHLRYFEGHDVQRVAQILGRPLGTVTKQLSRAHERLRKHLENEEQS